MSLEAAQAPVVEVLYPREARCSIGFVRAISKCQSVTKALLAAVRFRPEFQKRWDAEGPTYLKAAPAEISLDFPYREMQATLTVCLPASTSIPLIIDVTAFLPRHSVLRIGNSPR